jgi:hypothetical protein
MVRKLFNMFENFVLHFRLLFFEFLLSLVNKKEIFK